MGIRLLTNTLTIIPKTIVVIRSVSEKDKAMALSVMPFLIALLGWLLSPIVFGNAIDSTCQIWDIKCQKTGRCLLYDNNSFRVKLHGYGTLGISLGLVFLVLTYLFARYTKCLDKAAKNDVLPDKTAMALINVEYNGEKKLAC
ncbi:unnamed protein product [Candidula unifasciata]|uniref:Uncharacterized protein n=1 Tax=Candidula unifasciata TaxID=100452 RepID=A0A8S3ZG44_9EUPU|nr:unnamed protein product [Candidula unifasciata]